MNPRISHLVGLLAIIGPQLAVVWQDQQASLANKIAMSVVTLLTLLLTDPKKHATAVTLIRAGVAVAALVLSAILTKGTLGSVGTSVATTAIAVFVRLQALLPAPGAPVKADDTPTIPNGPRAVALVLLAGSLLLAGGARASEMPSPPLGGCFDEVTKIYCAGLVVPTAISGLKLTAPDAGALLAGAFPAGGFGYAFHLWWSQWHTASLAVAVAASGGTGSEKSSANIAGLLGFAKYVFVGTMVRIQPGLRDWYGLAGIDVLALVTEPATRAARASQGAR